MNRLIVFVGLLAVGLFASVEAKAAPTKCEICQDLVTAAELFVKFKGWNATDLLNGADKLCGVLGDFSDECTSIINAGGLPFASCVTSGGNTTQCCQDIPLVNFCSSKVTPKKSDRFTVKKPKITECQVCQDFITVAELFVKFEGWNATQLLNEADQLCGFLGTYATECKLVVNAGGAPLATCIAGGSNSTTCCQAIPALNICGSKVVKSSRIQVVKPKITECQVCTDLVMVAELFVKFEGWNASTIVAEADKLCGVLGQLSSECKAIVQLGGSNFANCIAGGSSNATQCCQAIPLMNICSASDKPAIALRPAAVKVPLCEVCQDIVMVAELFMKFEGWNASTVLAEADKLCSVMPSFATECQAIINAGGLNFATCITTGGNTTDCCNAIPDLKICPSMAMPKAKASPSECEICQDIVTVAEILVKFEGWNATTIVAEADKLCGYLGTYSAECKAIVYAGGMGFATCISTGGNSTQCCQDIPLLNICTSKAPVRLLSIEKPKVTECQICQDVVTVAELFVKFEGWNATQILDEADKLCGFLGTYASTCKAILAIGGQQLATCIASGDNTTSCCQAIPEVHICPSNFGKKQMDTCQICQDFVTVAELFVKFEGWNSTQLLAEVDQLCKFTGTFSTECDAIVNAGGMALAECITSGTNTTQCCQQIPALNLCKSVQRAPIPVATPVKKQSLRMKLN